MVRECKDLGPQPCGSAVMTSGGKQNEAVFCGEISGKNNAVNALFTYKRTHHSWYAHTTEMSSDFGTGRSTNSIA